MENTPATDAQDQSDYSFRTFQSRWQTDENGIMLAFSGGGTRAALVYGVLKALRETRIPTSSGDRSLLDEVHSISSVSGGSFTAAYNGLYGERIFEDYEDVFLRRNVQGALIRRVLNPFGWFKPTGRTEVAVDYYEKTVFGSATFSDMLGRERPCRDDAPASGPAATRVTGGWDRPMISMFRPPAPA